MPAQAEIRSAGYGVLAGKPGMPLVLVFTTDIQSSLNGAFTSVPTALHASGYTVASVDVTCHGMDVKTGEDAGLGCWADRIKAGGDDIFAPMVRKASAAITALTLNADARAENVIAVGVSRGGYAALRVAAADARIGTLVLLAPVTNLARLTEFKDVHVDAGTYGLSRDYAAFSKRRLFIQIGNSDTRVGTSDALEFSQGIVTAAGGAPVDVTTIITSNSGHGVAAQQQATEWVLSGAAPVAGSRAP